MPTTVGFPFALSNGSVRMARTPGDIAQSQLAFAIGTQVGERVMRPGWGIDITSTIWAVGGDLEEAVPEAIGLVFTRNFPAYVLKTVVVSRDPQRPFQATVEVRFSTDPDTGLDQTVNTDINVPAAADTFDWNTGDPITGSV